MALRRLRSSCEWLPVALGCWTIPRLSRASVLRRAACLGRLGYHLDRRGRRVAEANLRVMYGDRLSPRRCRRLLMACYRHTARVLLDFFWFACEDRERLCQWCAMEPRLAEWLKSHPGGIVITGHLGNWEVAGQTAVANGIELTSVAKRIGSAVTTRKVNRLRSRLGQSIVMADGAARGLLAALRRNRWVALLLDQATDPMQGGVWTDFLGLRASVSSLAAKLALKTGKPVGVVFAQALPDGRYLCRLLGTCHEDGRRDAAPEALTQQIVDLLCAAIRRHPTQWLVMYKRWKRWPRDADGSRYPFYSAPWSHEEAAGVYGTKTE